jgi:glutathione S-transferase
MALTIHHLQVSQSERIIWLCEELGVPYELKLYQRSPLLSPPDLADLHPMKAAPVIDDTTVDPPVRLAESPAVIEYIIQRHGGGRLALGKDHKDYAQYVSPPTFPSNPQHSVEAI